MEAQYRELFCSILDQKADVDQAFPFLEKIIVEKRMADSPDFESINLQFNNGSLWFFGGNPYDGPDTFEIKKDYQATHELFDLSETGLLKTFIGKKLKTYHLESTCIAYDQALLLQFSGTDRVLRIIDRIGSVGMQVIQVADEPG